MIHIYEVDVNLFLKIIWVKHLGHHFKTSDPMNDDQLGFRTHKDAINAALTKVLVYEIACMQHLPLAICDLDGKA